MKYVLSLVLLLATALPLSGQGGVLAVRSGQSEIRFETVEDFQIAGSRKVRLAPYSAGRLDPNEVKHLPRVELRDAGWLKTDPTGHIAKLEPSGKYGSIVLPESFAPKEAVIAATAQGRLAIQIFRNKKTTKIPEFIAPETFYAFLPGIDYDRSALSFVLNEFAFASLEEQLAAMSGFAASFPDSPRNAELREAFRTRLTDGLADFEHAGQWKDLLTTRKYADGAGNAYPSDAELGRLRRQTNDTIAFVEKTRAALASLAAAAEWDLLLQRYTTFEKYQGSFADSMTLHSRAFEESARVHATRSRAQAQRGMLDDAVAESSLALKRDPGNHETARLLENQKVNAAKLEAARIAPSLKVLEKDSPEDRRQKRSLYTAERAVADKDFIQAESMLKAAETENSDAPEILLVRAELLAAREHIAEALTLIDRYDRSVTSVGDRDRGEAVRNQILYDGEKKKAVARQKILALRKAGEYRKLEEAAQAALLLDPADEEFMLAAGFSAAVLRRTDASARLGEFLVRSDSLRGEPKTRQQVRDVLAAAKTPPRGRLPGTPNWLSGRGLPADSWYCPETAAFQIPFDKVTAFKLSMDFDWQNGKLLSIRSAFDDDKGLRSYKELSGDPAAPRPGAGNFVFRYLPSNPLQVDAAFEAKAIPSAVEPDIHIGRDKSGQPLLTGAAGEPRVVLAGQPQFSVPVLSVLEGPATVGVSGNAFFNPVIWDSLHYFRLLYDRNGRLAEAREIDADNIVRFTWSGDSLIEVRAYTRKSAEPYYLRSITYDGRRITGESYSSEGKSGKIRYIYTGTVLKEIRVEDSGVHDGHTWVAHMRPQG